MGMNQNQMFGNVNMQQGRYVSYNQFSNQMPSTKEVKPSPQIQQPKLDPNDEEAIGEHLYNFVDRIYPE